MQDRLLITGANGHLGRYLASELADRWELRAAVRSEGARDQLDALPAAARPEVRIVDYGDATALASAAADCRAIIHLVGILKEGSRSRYADAHEGSCEALARAAESAGVERIVYLSIVGAGPESTNSCLASKGRAEEILLRGAVPVVVLRAPMVLGPDDDASRALRGQASRALLALISGGRSLQQPIDAADVVAAVEAAVARPGLAGEVLEIGGPECLSHRALVGRAAALHGKRPVVLPIPLALMQIAVSIIERRSPDPPITLAMLGVLQHDDRVNAQAASERLGIKLTPLDQTLKRYVGPQTGPAVPKGEQE